MAYIQNPAATKQQTYEILKAFIDEHGYSPTYYELGNILGITHVAAHHRVSNLAKDKRVKFKYGQWRNIILQ